MKITRIQVFLSIAILLVAIFFMRSCFHRPIIRENQPYKIGYDTSWQVLGVMDKEREMTAFCTELLVAIAKSGEFSFQLVGMSEKDLNRELDKELVDAILMGFSPASWQKSKYLVSSPLITYGPTLVVPVRSTVSSIADLKGEYVGFKATSSWLYKLQDCCALFMTPYPANLTALEDLSIHKISAVVMPLFEAEHFVHAFYAKTLKVIYPPLGSEALRLVVKNTPDYLSFFEQFEKGWSQVKNDGTYEALLTKWGFLSQTEEHL